MKNKNMQYNHKIYIEDYSFYGGNLSEERFSPIPLSKDFYLVFSQIGRSKIKKTAKMQVRPICEKTKRKFSGESLREAPFSKGVLSIISINLLYKYYG